MTILSKNYNHPKSGDTIKVEPIRTLQAISKINDAAFKTTKKLLLVCP